MKNQKALLESEWHQAPDIKLAEYTKRYYTDYKGKRQCYKYRNYLYHCDVLDSGELVMTIFATDKKPLFRSFMTKDALKSQYYEDKKASGVLSLSALGRNVCGSGRCDRFGRRRQYS